MSLRQGWKVAALVMACMAAAAWSGAVRADGSCPAGGCTTGSCPTGNCAGECGSCVHCPKTTFCIEKAPKICFKCVCPKPVCEPCDIDGAGYYPTCWRPWAYPPNYNHCPVPPPGVLASQQPPLAELPMGTYGPETVQDGSLPAPRKVAPSNPDR